jgi:PITH domain
VRGSDRFLFFLCAGFEIGRGEVTPRRLRVYANRANIIDFSEVDDVQPSLNISLLEGETSVTEYPLRMAAFSSINSLSLFFVRKPQIILQTYSRPESCSYKSVCRVTP